MSRKYTLLIAIILSFIVGLGPIGVAIWYGYQETLKQGEANLIAIVKGITNFSNLSLEQINQGFKQLQSVGSGCNDAEVEKLRDFVVDLPYLIAANVVDSTGRIICSSWGQGNNSMVFAKPHKGAGQFYIEGPAQIALVNRTAVVISQVRENATEINAIVNPKFLKSGLIGDIGEQGFAAIIRYHDGHAYVKRGQFSPVTKIMQWDDSNPNYIKLKADFADGVSRYAVAMPIKYLQNTAVVVGVSKHWLLQDWFRNAITMGALGFIISLLLVFIVVLLTRKKLSLTSDMQRALKANEFLVYYQPIVDLQDKQKIIGAEALVRWQHRDDGLLMPDSFIATAERSNLIVPLTEWIIKESLNKFADILKQNKDFHLGFNISPRQIKSRKFVAMIDRILEQYDIAPNQLVFELIERGLVDDEYGQVVENFRQLRQRNIHIAIDDFGTGYSSLSYISKFPLSHLKIDKSFVEAIGTGAVTANLANTIIDMAKQLKLAMIAEGIETQEQADYLQQKGVQWGQGYLFAKPVPFDEFVAKLSD